MINDDNLSLRALDTHELEHVWRENVRRELRCVDLIKCEMLRGGSHLSRLHNMLDFYCFESDEVLFELSRRRNPLVRFHSLLFSLWIGYYFQRRSEAFELSI